jgi:hypothetical protein
MLRSSQRITRLQTCEIIHQYSQSSASLTSEALNVLQSLVTTELQQDVCLQKEQNFDTSVTALVTLNHYFTRSIFSFKELNITLNQFQVSVLDIQSDIINYLQQEKL